MMNSVTSRYSVFETQTPSPFIAIARVILLTYTHSYTLSLSHSSVPGMIDRPITRVAITILTNQSIQCIPSWRKKKAIYLSHKTLEE